MKKMLTNTLNKVMLLVVALLSQFTAFAADGDNAEETKWQAVSRMPQFWIGVALFILLITAFFVTGRNKNKQLA